MVFGATTESTCRRLTRAFGPRNSYAMVKRSDVASARARAPWGAAFWLVVAAVWVSSELAVEIAELANLRKGYSDTHQRGLQNFTRIMDEVAIPCSSAAKDPAWGVDAVSKLRAAALADPEGDALDKSFAALDGAPQAAAAE